MKFRLVTEYTYLSIYTSFIYIKYLSFLGLLCKYNI
jgi:hypothetical protein